MLSLLSTILELIPLGVVVVKRGGKIVLANGCGAEILSGTPGLSVRGGILVATSAAHDRALKAAIESASLNRLSRPSGFSIARREQRPLSVVVTAVRNQRATVRRVDAPQRALVLLSDPEREWPPDVELLASTFEFTPAESVIAAVLLRGYDIDDIAVRLAVSGHTVRNLLKRLFSKTNTKRQCELLYTLIRSSAALRFPALENRRSMSG
jgi:DNA-binding CsgD family transcriptional regulator